MSEKSKKLHERALGLDRAFMERNAAREKRFEAAQKAAQEAVEKAEQEVLALAQELQAEEAEDARKTAEDRLSLLIEADAALEQTYAESGGGTQG